MTVTKKQLEDLEFQLADAVHDFGQLPMCAVMGRFFFWANQICPGFADDWGIWFPDDSATS